MSQSPRETLTSISIKETHANVDLNMKFDIPNVVF